MFKFIHAADIHLDSPQQGLAQYESAPVDEMRLATRKALTALVDLAIDQRVDFVLIAGDVYDGDWKDYNTGLFFVKQMSRLREANIPVVLISGNHDAANKMTKELRLPDNVELLSSDTPQTAKSRRFADLGVAIHGRSFAREAETENLALDYPVKVPGCFNIGLLHTSLEGAEGHDRYAPCSIGDLRRKEYDYWALGHVHQRRIVFQNPWIVFSGNTQGRHIRETGAKGCYVVTVNDAKINLDFKPLDVMRWEVCPVNVEAIDHPADMIDVFVEALARLRRQHGDLPLAIRVVVEGRSRAHEAILADPLRWTNELRGAALDHAAGAVWMEKLIFKTAPIEMDARMSGDGPLAALFDCLQELRGDEGQLRELTEELSDLKRRLPDRLVRGVDSLGWDDPDRMREWLDQIQPMIYTRLVGARSCEDS